jgi:hypothetical protein
MLQTSNMKSLLISACLFFVVGIASAQQSQYNDTGTVRRFLEKTHRAYLAADRLSFKVWYGYANLRQPGKYIDTLSGKFAIHRNNMYSMIGGTETVVNARFTIQVIEDEKLIYLARTSRKDVMDPLRMLDSLLLQAEKGQAVIVPGKQSSTLNIHFEPGQSYRNISITIDEQSGFFQKVTYDLFAADWVNEEQISQPGKPSQYEKEGRVEIIFSNYQKGKFNDSLFEESAYFTRQGASFEPAERYSGYRVFVASPNL